MGLHSVPPAVSSSAAEMLESPGRRRAIPTRLLRETGDVVYRDYSNETDPMPCQLEMGGDTLWREGARTLWTARCNRAQAAAISTGARLGTLFDQISPTACISPLTM